MAAGQPRHAWMQRRAKASFFTFRLAITALPTAPELHMPSDCMRVVCLSVYGSRCCTCQEAGDRVARNVRLADMNIKIRSLTSAAWKWSATMTSIIPRKLWPTNFASGVATRNCLPHHDSYQPTLSAYGLPCCASLYETSCLDATRHKHRDTGQEFTRLAGGKPTW